LISLNPFLKSPGEQPVDGPRAVSTLLDGIALYSFGHNPAEVEAFRQSLREIGDEIALAGDESASVLAASAVRMLKEHLEAVERHFAARHQEMETALALVSGCLIAIGDVDGKLSQELRESQRDVSAARNAGDAEAARTRLSLCLEGIRRYVLRRSQGTPLSSQIRSKDEIDALTGLPDSRQAVEAIITAWDLRDDYNAVAFAVRRLDTINARYGFQAGDEMLQVMSNHVKEIFADKCLLFRWRGPYLLALTDKHSTELAILPQLKRLAYTNIQRTLSVRDREVLLSISIACKLVPLEAPSIEEMIQALDELTTMGLR